MLVDSVLEAGRAILRDQGPEALTVKRLCEVAGVGVGSLYEYFATKEDVIRAILERIADDAGEDIERIFAELRDEPLLEGCQRAFMRLVNYHRDMLRMQPEFYRVYQRELMPYPRRLERVRAGHEAQQAFLQVLQQHPERVRAEVVTYAPFLMARGAAAILETAVQERPEYIFDDDFIAELQRLFMTYYEAAGDD